jgi:hypothetical protein
VLVEDLDEETDDDADADELLFVAGGAGAAVTPVVIVAPVLTIWFIPCCWYV